MIWIVVNFGVNRGLEGGKNVFADECNRHLALTSVVPLQGTFWLVSQTITPIQCLDLLPDPKPGQEGDARGGRFYKAFRGLLQAAIRARFPFVGALVALLVGAMFVFNQLPQQFFPDSARPQFLIDYWAPEGTRRCTGAGPHPGRSP